MPVLFKLILGVALLMSVLMPHSGLRAAPEKDARPDELNVVLDDNYPPYVFRDSSGVLQGYLVDLWQLWQRKTGVKVNLLADDWDKVQQLMANGKADVIDSIFVRPERMHQLDFMASHESVPVSIYMQKNIEGIVDLKTLHGFLVGVKAGDACVKQLEYADVTNLTFYASYTLLVQAAISDQVNVFCMDEPPANYLLYRSGSEHLFKKAFTLYIGQLSRAVHKGDAKTLTLMEHGFAAILPHEMQDLHDKWMGHDLTFSSYGLYLTYGLLAALLLSAILTLWGMTLRRMVKQRTTELQNEHSNLRVLLEAIPDRVWLKDANGVYVYCNPMALKFFERDEAEVIGKSDFELFDDAEARDYFYHDLKVMIEKKSDVYERMFLSDAGSQHRYYEITKTPMYDAEGDVNGVLGIARNITERRQTEIKIHQLAEFDSLTGLPNRSSLNQHIEQAIIKAENSELTFAVLFVDLDHFKNVNDTLGHRIGDCLLVEVAERLKSAMREDDTVARWGGDEFILLLPNIDAPGAANVAQKLLAAMVQAYQIEQHSLVISPSIGIAMYPRDGNGFDRLYQCADVAMYRAKHEGRNNYRFFTPEMNARSTRNLQLENALRTALERQQLYLQYQPQLSLANNRVIGVEVLLRWQHPEFGLVPPDEFISIAENSGQILAIGEWVLRTAVAQFKQWLEAGLAPINLSVNLSAVQFRHSHLPEMVTQILQEANVSAEYLELELTEGTAMENPQHAIAVMDDLHQRGIRMSIDDFGTGYSSLSYLKRFQVYKLKIDRSFVLDLIEDEDDQAIVNAIISLANKLGMQTIAEGVETEEQLDFLQLHGCDEVQGYYFSKPLMPDQLAAFVLKRQVLNH